jgi:peptidyl-prolyl cis-trans isomerase C
MKVTKEKQVLIFLLALLVVLFLFSCSKEKEDKETGVVIATVNNEQLTAASIVEFTGSETLAVMTEEEQRERVDDLIKLTVLAQEADKRGLNGQTEIKERIKIAEKKIKANALLAKMFEELEVTESEVFNYYQIHKSRYAGEREEYRVQRILLENEEMADSVSTMIVDGELNFAEAARAYSREQARERDGYLGYLTPDEMEQFIWNSIRNLSQWRFVRVPVSNGIYLVRYTDVRNRETERPFTEVSDQVREELLEERRRDLVNELLDELLSSSEIVISG